MKHHSTLKGSETNLQEVAKAGFDDKKKRKKIYNFSKYRLEKICEFLKLR